MKKILKVFNGIMDTLGNLMFIFMLLIMLLQIAARFLFRISIPWTEEMSRLIFLYVVFIGAAIATRKGSHLVIDSLSMRVPKSIRKPYQLFILIASLAVIVLFLIGSYHMVAVSTRRYFSSMITLPMSWMYLAPAIGFTFMCLYYIVDIVKILTDKEDAA